MRPADDHVARFVKHVSRGRYIKVDAVMDKGATVVDGALPRFRAGTTLDIAVKGLSDAGRDAAVITDDSDKPVGGISLRQIMAAL